MQTEEFDRALGDGDGLSSALLSTLAAIVVALDRDGRIVLFNGACENLTGYAASEVLGRCIWDLLLTEDDVPSVKAVFDHLAAGDFPNAHENEWVCKDGGRRMIAWSNTALMDDAGDVAYVLGTGIDITAREEAERALREQQALLRQMADNLPDTYLSIVESDLTIGFTSGAAFASQGLDPDSFVGLTLEQVFGEHAPEVEAHYRRTFEGDRTTFELRINGQDQLYRTMPLPSEDGTIGRILTVVEDITKRRRMERLLAARLSLAEFALAHTVGELLQKTLDEVCALVVSPIGFYHFVEPDERTLSLRAWSTRTLEEFCTAEAAGRHYPIEQAGVWADCIRERRPVVHDDVASLPHLKGVPTGHAPVVRELVVPIFRAGRIVAVLGVGNKPTSYTPEDVELVSTAADFGYELVSRRAAEAELAEAKAFIEVALDSQRDTFFVFDPATSSSVRWNRAFREVSGYSDEEIAAMPAPQTYYSQEDLERASAALEEILNAGSAKVEMSLICKDGRTVPTEYSGSLIEGAEPGTNYVVAVGRDVTERRKAEQALRESAEKLRSLSDNIPGTVYQVACGEDGSSRVFTYLSAGVEAIHGVTVEEAMRDASALYGQVFEEDVPLLIEREREAMFSMSQMQAEFRIRRPDGGIRWVLVMSKPRKTADDHLVFDGFELDITRMKLLEEEIRELSFRDPLTGLYNRRGLLLLVEQAMREADRGDSPLGLVYLDVDGLKKVNDTLGHPAGDRLLRLAADAMRSTFREADIIGRVGGDEFAVCASVSGDEELSALLDRLQAAVSASHGVPPCDLALSMSWGTAVYRPSSPASLDALLAEADRRMYEKRRAKTDIEPRLPAAT